MSLPPENSTEQTSDGPATGSAGAPPSLRRIPDLAPLYLVLAAGLTTGTILQQQKLDYCPNDASRWNTVYYLVEHGTFEYLPQHGAWWSPEDYKTPWEIGPFWTIDMIARQDPDGQWHYYSSKPPLLATLVAGVVRGIEIVTLGHADFRRHPWFIIRTTLIITQVIPLLVLIWIYRVHLYRASESPFVRHFCLAAAAAGTYLTAWTVTLNNHTAAAFTCLMAVHAAIRIWYDGRREGYRFAAAGLFAALTACFELPAGLLAVALLAALLWTDWKKTLAWGLPPAAIVAGAALLLNFLSIGQWMPAYAEVNKPGGLYDYPGSYWTQRTGLDALAEPKLIYLLHMLIGHHGFFLLTPIMGIALVGLIAELRCSFRAAHRAGHSERAKGPDYGRANAPVADESVPGQPTRGLLAAFILVLTATVAGVYCMTTNNYGGTAQGFRWLFWVIPLWLLFLPRGTAMLEKARFGRGLCYLLLGVSVMSMAFALRTPWADSWAHLLFRQLKWIQY